MGVMSLRPPSFKAHFLGSWGFYVFLYQLRKTAVPFHKAWPGSNEDHMHTKLGANPEVKPESRARHCHLPTFSICPFSYAKLTSAPVLWSILGVSGPSWSFALPSYELSLQFLFRNTRSVVQTLAPRPCQASPLLQLLPSLCPPPLHATVSPTHLLTGEVPEGFAIVRPSEGLCFVFCLFILSNPCSMESWP